MSSTSSGSRFEEFLVKAFEEDPVTRAAYEDAQSRSRLVDTLVRFRHRLGLTQTQVASAMGVKQPTISGFETEGSDPRLSTIQRYARSVDAVLVWTVQPRRALAGPQAYVEVARDVHTSVNRREPSRRAREWKAREPYHHPDAASPDAA